MTAMLRRQFNDIKMATTEGFEPSRAEHNGLAGHRLNHSAKLSEHYAQPLVKNNPGGTRTLNLVIRSHTP